MYVLTVARKMNRIFLKIEWLYEIIRLCYSIFLLVLYIVNCLVLHVYIDAYGCLHKDVELIFATYGYS
jgi:hypothetical protein